MKNYSSSSSSSTNPLYIYYKLLLYYYTIVHCRTLSYKLRGFIYG
ncbi:unnamed protein product [marine sediment metagenome]|uniref:Uncharacterized protein n=1 Tax=marine sediment metagenome TaxID=412755 RepID=X1N603_9ZZZZ